MRICRVAISYPTSQFPGAGLVNYYLSNILKSKTLYITIKRPGIPKKKISKNLKIKFIDTPLQKSSTSLNHQLHDKSSNFITKLIVYIKIISSGRSFNFFRKSIIPILRFKPDLIACHSNLTIIHGYFFKTFFNIKYVLHLHAISDVIAIQNYYIIKYMASKAERIYCVSEPMQNQLKKIFPTNKIFLSSTGVDPEIFIDKKQKRKNILISVGQLKWYKGHKYAIEAMPIIINKLGNIELLIIGNGEEEQNLKYLVQKKNLSKYVKFIPQVEHHKLVEYYNKSKLLIMPSLYEGLPKVLLESFACGLPAVITTACNAQKISINRAKIVRTKSSKLLAEAAIKILKDKKKWMKFSLECRKIIDSKNWKTISNDIYLDYKQILNK